MAAQTAVQRKEALRARLKLARRLIPREERERVDAAITERLVALPAYRHATLVLSYLSFGSEVDTRALIERAWADGKLVALPRCVRGTREMAWYRVSSLEALVRGPLGVLEPAGDPALRQEVGASEDELVVVPGLTFDLHGYRLGYGGGYYDTLLSGCSGVSVGLCRTSQLSRDLVAQGVVEEHDLPVDAVVTEGGVIWPS